MALLSKYLYTGEQKYKTGQVKSDETSGIRGKEAGIKRLEKNRLEISQTQVALYAEEKQSLLLVLQAMDAAGKDGAIRHVFYGVDPQGLRVHSFRQPDAQDLARDFLWRIHQDVPERGVIGIFNRSHYEDVLISKVLDLPARQALPDRARKEIWKKRYRQITEFERMLVENGTTVVKIYLHLSKEEQARRFLERLETPDKQWKFSLGDVKTSQQWPAYMDAYEDMVNHTATSYAPWWVVPADKKWYARAVISEIVLQALRKMKPKFPEANIAGNAEIEQARTDLASIAGQG